MNSVIQKFVFLWVVIVSSSSAFADVNQKLPSFRMIEIKAEYYPGETYYLGYAENPDHSINSIFYEDNKQHRKFYSFADLTKDVAIIQNEVDGSIYDLVRMNSQVGDESGTYKVTISYMKNGLFRNRSTVHFNVAYNPQRQLYEAKDARNGQLVNRANAITNFWGSRAVGISEIQVLN